MTKNEFNMILHQLEAIRKGIEHLVDLAERGQANEDAVALSAEVIEDVAAEMGYAANVLGAADPEAQKPLVRLGPSQLDPSQ